MNETLDWVEQETGAPGPSHCARHGHRKVRVSEPVDVHGHPAAHFECEVCGLRGFHWIGKRPFDLWLRECEMDERRRAEA